MHHWMNIMQSNTLLYWSNVTCCRTLILVISACSHLILYLSACIWLPHDYSNDKPSIEQRNCILQETQRVSTRGRASSYACPCRGDKHLKTFRSTTKEYIDIHNCKKKKKQNQKYTIHQRNLWLVELSDPPEFIVIYWLLNSNIKNWFLWL